MGKQWKQWLTLFFGAPKSLQMVTAAMNLKAMNFPWEESYDQPRWHIKKQRHIHTEYYSAIRNNTFESVLIRWMILEPIIQSEISQKEKYKYSILTHIYGI